MSREFEYPIVLLRKRVRDDDAATACCRNESTFPRLIPRLWKCVVMNNPDQDTLIRAVEDARRILAEYIEPGPRDATRTVERLMAVLDRNDIVHALDRIKRRRVMRLVE
jgi:hypothetical protein